MRTSVYSLGPIKRNVFSVQLSVTFGVALGRYIPSVTFKTVQLTVAFSPVVSFLLCCVVLCCVALCCVVDVDVAGTCLA